MKFQLQCGWKMTIFWEKGFHRVQYSSFYSACLFCRLANNMAIWILLVAPLKGSADDILVHLLQLASHDSLRLPVLLLLVIFPCSFCWNKSYLSAFVNICSRRYSSFWYLTMLSISVICFICCRSSTVYRNHVSPLFASKLFSIFAWTAKFLKVPFFLSLLWVQVLLYSIQEDRIHTAS